MPVRRKAVDGVAATKKIRWLNKGGPFRSPSGTIINHGKTFFAEPFEIPESFRDVIVPVDPIVDASVVEAVLPGYTTVLVDADANTFNILDGRGKIVNESPLSAEDAEAFLARMRE